MDIRFTGTLLIAAAVISDVIANIYVKKSNGFKKKLYSAIALLLVALAFYFLSEAVKIMDLSIAYASFGALGIILTTIIDKTFFNLKIKGIGIAGILCIVIGIILIKTA